MRLVGRESDFQVITRILDTASAGPAGLVLEGPPGIGKTELWREGERRAASAGYRVLTARPVEVEVIPPRWATCSPAPWTTPASTPPHRNDASGSCPSSLAVDPASIRTDTSSGPGKGT